MGRPIFLLTLLAALTGTPLRQAEAANDLVRLLANLGGGDDIEEVDGGVGDDPGVMVLKAGSNLARTNSCVLPVADCPGTLPPADRSVRGFSASRRGDRATPLFPRSSRHHAWLQCFLF
jgi:hypothetical protein